MFSKMKRRARAFPSEHPVLWQTLLWSLPALAFGFVLRAMLLSYSPLAYWGSDSRSYFEFTTRLLIDGDTSLNEKRRFLYPLFLLPVTLLPGSPIRWVALLQAGLGLASILPVAYVVRRVFTGWKWWIVPATLLYTGLPIFLWYEHEVLAECLFFSAITWAIGGWVAWVLSPAGARKTWLWWWFFAPFAVMLLTKPSGRFLLPGIVLALLVVKAWRFLRWRAALAAAALLALVSAMGNDEQGAWLLYVSAFPFTQLESPQHADYKREVVDLVEYARADLMRFADEDDDVFQFLRSPGKQEERPLWRALGKDEDLRVQLYTELALEGIAAEPVAFVSLSLNRILASVNPEEFKVSRFGADYFGERFASVYADSRNPREMLRLAFNAPKSLGLPPEPWFRLRTSPHPDSRAAVWLEKYAAAYQRAARLFQYAISSESGSRTTPWPTLLGWFVLGSALVAMGWHTRTIGVWIVIAATYLIAVFLVGVQHPRYLAPVWPVVILLLPALPDALYRAGIGIARKRRSDACYLPFKPSTPSSQLAPISCRPAMTQVAAAMMRRRFSS